MKIAAFHSPGLPFRMFGFLQGANVLSTKTGIIKLADFGVATKLSEIDSSKRRVVGTPYWMAPETVETLGLKGGKTRVTVKDLGKPWYMSFTYPWKVIESRCGFLGFEVSKLAHFLG